MSHNMHSLVSNLYDRLVNFGECRGVEFRCSTAKDLLVTAIKDINGVPQQITISLGNYQNLCHSPQINAVTGCAYWSIMNTFKKMSYPQLSA